MSVRPDECLKQWKIFLLKTEKEKIFFSLSSVSYFPWGWAALFGVVLLDMVWARNNAWLKLPFSLLSIVACLPFALNIRLVFNLLPAVEIPALRWILSFSKRISLGTEYSALVFGIVLALSNLSYLACTLHYPLVDQQLNHVDQLIGFDWARWYRWSQRPSIYIILSAAYGSMLPQLVFFIIWFTFLAHKNRLYEMFWILGVALLMTIFVSGLLPSLGPVFILNWPQPDLHAIQLRFSGPMLDVTSIRSGISPDFTLHKPTGVITFPSFHTVCAIVFSYGFRRTGLVGYSVFLLNIVMLISIPFLGNHYLVDMIAGAFVALISIAAVRALYHKTGPRLNLADLGSIG